MSITPERYHLVNRSKYGVDASTQEKYIAELEKRRSRHLPDCKLCLRVAAGLKTEESNQCQVHNQLKKQTELVLQGVE